MSNLRLVALYTNVTLGSKENNNVMYLIYITTEIILKVTCVTANCLLPTEPQVSSNVTNLPRKTNSVIKLKPLGLTRTSGLNRLEGLQAPG